MEGQQTGGQNRDERAKPTERMSKASRAALERTGEWFDGQSSLWRMEECESRVNMCTCGPYHEQLRGGELRIVVAIRRAERLRLHTQATATISHS